MELAKNGVTTTTPKSILLGAGTIYKDLIWTPKNGEVAGAWTGTILGATQGGNKISIKNSIKPIEIDGAMVSVMGLDMMETQEASIEVNLIELSKESLRIALLAKDGESEVDGFDLLEMKGTIEPGDYLKNIAFVGFKTDNTPIIIILENAICTSGLEADAKPKEGTVAKVTFESRANPETSIDTLPVKIYVPSGKAN